MFYSVGLVVCGLCFHGTILFVDVLRLKGVSFKGAVYLCFVPAGGGFDGYFCRVALVKVYGIKKK